MLILTRKVGESITLHIGGGVKISVLRVWGDDAKKVKLAITAPAEIRVIRQSGDKPSTESEDLGG